MFSRSSGQGTRWLSWYGVGLASADRLPVVLQISASPCADSLGNSKPFEEVPRYERSHEDDYAFINLFELFYARLWVGNVEI